MPLVICYRPVPQFAPAFGARSAAPGQDERPRDFTARIRRRDAEALGRTLAPARQRRRRAWATGALALLGLGLGPLALASAPIEAASGDGLASDQPFEQAGESFPGSAYYYVDQRDSGVLAPKAAFAAWESHARDESEASLAAPAAGPAARPLLAHAGGEDYARALQCLTAAIYYEAASEPDGGQRAVAQVVLNRVLHPSYPNTVCGVVYQGSERPGCQFSFACDGSLARRPVPAFWERARRIAGDALAGYVYAPVGLATHYHTTAVHPYWASSLAFIGTIGAHRFYRWAGAAGRPAAFNAVYAGREPLPFAHPRTMTPERAAETDPVQLARAYEDARQSALKASTPVANPAPAYAPAVEQRGGEALYKAQGLPSGAPASGSGSVLPQYENSGKWIAQPGA